MKNKNSFKMFYQYRNIIIIISFFIFSILSTSLLIHSHFLGGGSDTYFHWQRIIELKKSFNYHHFFPQIALNEFNDGGGSAVMTFYPYLNILPVVLLSFIIKSSINLMYISFSLYTFIALIVSYYSSLHINQRIDTSYLFSIMYSLSAFMLSTGFQSMDLGILFTLIFLPLIIFGFIDFIKNNHWIQLSFGLTLFIFSHVLNSIFILILLFIWLIINYKSINYNKFIYLIKGLVLILITTSIFYLPFLKLLFLNNINSIYTFPLNGTSFPNLFNNALTNSTNYTLGLFSIIGAIIIPLLFYKYFNKFIKQMYWISIAIIIICSDVFPWYLLQNTPIKIIQLPWRLYFIPQLLLTYIFALGITKYLNDKNLKKILISGVICLTLFLQFSAQNTIINKYKNNNNISTHIQNDQQLFSLGNYKMNGSKEMNYLLYGFNASDYYPKESMVWLDKLRNEQGIYDINHSINFQTLKNGKFQFINNHKRIQELNIPFVIYNGIHYKVYLNNHEVPFNVNKTNLLTLSNINKGTYHVQIKVIPGISDIIIRILFFIGIAIYIWLFFWNLYGKNKINIISLYKKHNS